MKISILMMIAAVLAGCDPKDHWTPPEAYQRWQDRIVVATGIPFFGLKPLCSTRWVGNKNVGYYDTLPIDQCIKFDAPRRMQGLWRNNFEGSQFCPAPAQKCPDDAKDESIWFDYSFGVTDTEPRKLKVPRGGLYAVDFIGRKTSYRGAYGHFGGSDQEVLVDRMIAIKELEAPPKPAEQDQTLK